MANRFVLNETSYHGKGAIDEIPNEAKARGFKKALVCSDPDLIKCNWWRFFNGYSKSCRNY